MSKKILIDTTNTQETRIAVTEDGKLDDFEVENNKKNAVKGDVYLAKITRIEPSLQAAFVDFGTNRNGFLPLTEIHPDYFKIPAEDEEVINELNNKMANHDEAETEILDKDRINEEEIINNEELNENNFDENDDNKQKIRIKNKFKNKKINPKKEYFNFFRKYKIQDVIRPRQVILVQINKEERGLKGAALTTYLSFAGRYCVLMPNSTNNDGISRKIGDIEERKKLKQILASVKIPERMSVIVRTAGIGRTKKEISKDLTFLVSQWNKIRELTLKSEAPQLIYEEGSVLKRAIRDMLSEDITDIFVDGKEGYNKVKKITKNIVPSFVKKIKQFKNKDNSLFAEHNIETQINDLFSLSVKLKSGGSIVINTTEALVAIDVNSGKNTSERNIENTALKTNLEAATEIARQLRLRDLGGLVVIDFIDMDDYRNNFKVEKTLKSALVRDRARVQLGRISMFGLLELSRQRLRSSLIDKSFDRCNYCKGSGMILNSISITEQIIKVIKEKLSNMSKSEIFVKCNTELAENLLNLKKEEIFNLELQYNTKINFSFNGQHSLNDPLIEVRDLLDNKDNEIKIKKNNKINEVANKKRKVVKKKVLSKDKKIINIDKNKKQTTSKKKKSIKNNDESLVSNSDENNEEKTGWWS